MIGGTFYFRELYNPNIILPLELRDKDFEWCVKILVGEFAVTLKSPDISIGRL